MRRKAITVAPIAGQALKRPSPCGPTCRISEAKTGSIATAPPKSTANISSENAPRSSGVLKTKSNPLRILRKIPSEIGATSCLLVFTPVIIISEVRNKPRTRE